VFRQTINAYYSFIVLNLRLEIINVVSIFVMSNENLRNIKALHL